MGRIPAIGNEGVRQLLDYELLEELVDGAQHGYIARVKARLLDKNVYFSKQSIQARASGILHGSVVIQPSADVNGIPAARNGKDRCYAGFFTMIDMALPNDLERKYIGLAANQIDVIRSNVAPVEMVVCEHDAGRAERLSKMITFLHRTKPGLIVELVQQDIFKYLEECNKRFNILDLDLMVHLPREEKLDRWTRAIHQATTPGKIVLNLTASVGRKNTDADHSELVEYFNSSLSRVGFTISGYSRHRYCDRVTPMRAERYILEKGDDNDKEQD